MNAARGGAEFRAWAVVPAKALWRAKSRLDSALGPVERRRFARALLERVVHACRGCERLSGVLIATDGGDVARLAARHRARIALDPPVNGAPLSAIVDRALSAAAAAGATHALVLMADLPFIRAHDVAELIAALRDAPRSLVLAPDAHRRGTSALGLPLDAGFRTRFGRPDSALQHARAAERAGLALRIVYNPRVAYDLDTPEDARRVALPVAHSPTRSSVSPA